jgi:hypothetical protein
VRVRSQSCVSHAVALSLTCTHSLILILSMTHSVSHCDSHRQSLTAAHRATCVSIPSAGVSLALTQSLTLTVTQTHSVRELRVVEWRKSTPLELEAIRPQ